MLATAYSWPQATRTRFCYFLEGRPTLRRDPRSEGEDYWPIADYFERFNHSGVKPRASTEELSMDSFENLLFGLCRFKELVGIYPEQLTVVG
jgi:hypothetical protein